MGRGGVTYGTYIYVKCTMEFFLYSSLLLFLFIHLYFTLHTTVSCWIIVSDFPIVNEVLQYLYYDHFHIIPMGLYIHICSQQKNKPYEHDMCVIHEKP